MSDVEMGLLWILLGWLLCSAGDVARHLTGESWFMFYALSIGAHCFGITACFGLRP